jgi:peroxiredoxin
MTLSVGQQFPVDIAVDSPRGMVSVADLLADGPAVVTFHRLWCPFCQQAARELAAAQTEIADVGGQVAIVYREDVATVQQASRERGMPFLCLSDTHRELEAAVEIHEFAVGHYAAFSPRKFIDALRSGSRIGMPRSGILQGRGTFVVDRNGSIGYAHHSRTAADIAPVSDVVEALRATT